MIRSCSLVAYLRAFNVTATSAYAIRSSRMLGSEIPRVTSTHAIMNAMRAESAPVNQNVDRLR
jgi:hypothetical protein